MISKLFTASLLLLLGCTAAYGQEAQKKGDTLKRGQVDFRAQVPQDAAGRKRMELGHYRRTLGIDSARAEQVLRVQSEYKSAMRKVVSDTSLNDAGKRAAIDRLIERKNVQLEGLLTPAQQSKVIPTTERRGKAQ